jgi:hypothetical protein
MKSVTKKKLSVCGCYGMTSGNIESSGTMAVLSTCADSVHSIIYYVPLQESNRCLRMPMSHPPTMSKNMCEKSPIPTESINLCLLTGECTISLANIAFPDGGGKNQRSWSRSNPNPTIRICSELHAPTPSTPYMLRVACTFPSSPSMSLYLKALRISKHPTSDQPRSANDSGPGPV